MGKFDTACLHCSKRFKAPDQANGKALRCPACNKKFVVKPISLSSNQFSSGSTGNQQSARKHSRSSETKKQKFERLKTSLEGCFKPVSLKRERVGPLYLVGLALVAFVMLLLPIIYLAMIIAVGFGLSWHAIHNVVILTTPGGGFYGMVFKVLIYLAPIFGGLFVIIFMIKPIFARPVDKFQRRFITRQGEPVVFWLIDQICQKLSCPKPNRIYVNCDVNASASYRTGFLSFLHGSDFSLSFGMPLVSCMSTQQFAGILAHEFGHFSQRGGMRFTFVIRSVNAWFYRVSTQRDSWDEWLDNSIEDESGHWTLDLLFMFAIFCVWLSRRILMFFLLISHGISSFLLRQMEYSADAFEIQLSGTANFTTTSHRLRHIGRCFNQEVIDLLDGLHKKKANRNIPMSLARRASIEREAVAVEGQRATTSFFDSHPSDSSRISKAEKQDVEGVFCDNRTASDLFFGFEDLCRKVTEDFYRVNLGIAVGKKSRRQKKDWMVE